MAQTNDVQLKLVKVRGEFVGHRHDDTDETFLVLFGTLVIETEEGDLVFGPGQMAVIPRGLVHRPVAAEECHLMLVEPTGVVNTGSAGTDRTAPNDVWL